METASAKSSAMFPSANLLGVRFDICTQDQVLGWVESVLVQDKIGKKLFTPNPEMLVKAQSDEHFREILNQSDLNICDGRGTELVLKLRSTKVTRYTGVDCLLDTCALAERLGKSIYLLGSGGEGVVGKTAETLQKKFPNLKIVGCNKGPQIRENNLQTLDFDREENTKILQEISLKQSDILFVAFGMGKQEKWISEFLPQLTGVKLALGVGGAFDYIAGVIPRAPGWMRWIGLEWLYRLWQEPARWPRIWRATVVFWWLVLKNKLK
jgi:N-acetylglucosaminyldiphosphoundecaprenol N-acetyl-beta-D-mannosaminyltransferase